MKVCPYCQWPLATQSQLETHIEIKHKGGLSNLLKRIQDDCKNAPVDELDDDGAYIGDTVIHTPYDDLTEE